MASPPINPPVKPPVVPPVVPPVFPPPINPPVVPPVVPPVSPPSPPINPPVTPPVIPPVSPPLAQPTFGTTINYVDGFSSSVNDYISAESYSFSTSAGTVTPGTPISGAYLYPFVVSGLSQGTSATVTVTASETGFTSSVGTLTSSSLTAGTSTATVSNQLNNSFDLIISFGANISSAQILYGSSFGSQNLYSTISSSGTVTISGLNVNTTYYWSVKFYATSVISPNKVLIQTAIGTATTTITPTIAPTLDAPVSTLGGFTGNITNFIVQQSYTFATSAGTISYGSPPSFSGYPYPYTVSGLSNGQSATVTVTASEFNYSSTTGTATGTALSFGTPNVTIQNIQSESFDFNITLGTNNTSANIYISEISPYLYATTSSNGIVSATYLTPNTTYHWTVYGMYGSNQETSISGSTTTLQSTSIPVNTAAPVITQDSKSYTFTATTGSWSHYPTSYTYYWYVNGILYASGSSYSSITLDSTYVGKSVYCGVTATNSAGTSSATNSNTLTVLIPSGNVVISTTTTQSSIKFTATWSSGVTSVDIYYNTVNTSYPNYVGTISSNGGSVTQKGLATNKVYYYKANPFNNSTALTSVYGSATTSSSKAYIKINGAWSSGGQIYVKISGSWQPASQAYIKSSGTWKPFLT